jgi:hypothetical protein
MAVGVGGWSHSIGTSLYDCQPRTNVVSSSTGSTCCHYVLPLPLRTVVAISVRPSNSTHHDYQSERHKTPAHSSYREQRTTPNGLWNTSTNALLSYRVSQRQLLHLNPRAPRRHLRPSPRRTAPPLSIQTKVGPPCPIKVARLAIHQPTTAF